jgi:hypothetical protein
MYTYECMWVSEWVSVCVCVCVCVRIYAYIWVIYVTYSIKQVRYSGVNDGNTPIKHTPSHEQIRMTRLKTSELIWDHCCRLSCAYPHGPTHTQVQITWSFVSISSSHFIFQGKLTLLLKSFVAGLLTNPCQNSVMIHRLWPQLTLIHNWNFNRSTSIHRRSMLQLFRSSWSGVRRAKLYPTHVRYLFPHLTFLPPSSYPISCKKTCVVLGYGLVRRSKPTSETSTLLVQRCTPDPNSLVRAAAS